VQSVRVFDLLCLVMGFRSFYRLLAFVPEIDIMTIFHHERSSNQVY
jgi:hypothetical protein